MASPFRSPRSAYWSVTSVERETVAKCTSLGCWTIVLLPKALSPRARIHHEHDATWQIPAHLAKGYSAECVEGEFCEVATRTVIFIQRIRYTVSEVIIFVATRAIDEGHNECSIQ